MNNTKKLVAYAVALALASSAKAVSAEVVNNTTLESESKKASVSSNFRNSDEKDLKEAYNEYKDYLNARENAKEGELIVFKHAELSLSGTFLNAAFLDLSISDIDGYSYCDSADFSKSYILCYPTGSLTKGSPISLDGMNLVNEYGKSSTIKPINLLSHLEQFTWYSPTLSWEVYIYDLNGNEYVKSGEMNLMEKTSYEKEYRPIDLSFDIDFSVPESEQNLVYGGSSNVRRYYIKDSSEVTMTYVSAMEVGFRDDYPNSNCFRFSSMDNAGGRNDGSLFSSDGCLEMFDPKFGYYGNCVDKFYKSMDLPDGLDIDSITEFSTFELNVGPYKFKCAKSTLKFKTKSHIYNGYDSTTFYLGGWIHSEKYDSYITSNGSNSIDFFLDRYQPVCSELNSSVDSVCNLVGNELFIKTSLQDICDIDGSTSSWCCSTIDKDDGVWLEIYDKNDPSDRKIIVPNHRDYSTNLGQEIYRTEVNDTIDLSQYFSDFKNFDGTLIIEVHSKDMVGNEGLACKPLEIVKEANTEVVSTSVDSSDYSSEDGLSYWFTGNNENIKLSVTSKNTSNEDNGVYPSKNKFSLVNGSSIYHVIVDENGGLTLGDGFDSYFEVVNSTVDKKEEFTGGEYIYYLTTNVELKPKKISSYDFYAGSFSKNQATDFVGIDTGLDVKMDSTAPNKTGKPYFSILENKLSVNCKFYDSGVGVDPNNVKVKIYNSSTGNLLSEHDVTATQESEGSTTYVLDAVIEDENLSKYTCKVEVVASDLLSNSSAVFTYNDSNNYDAIKVTNLTIGGHEYKSSSSYDYYDKIKTEEDVCWWEGSLLYFIIESKFNSKYSSWTNPIGNEMILTDSDTNEKYSIYVDQYGKVSYSDNFLDAFSATLVGDSDDFQASVVSKGSSSTVSSYTHYNLKTKIALQPKISGKVYTMNVKSYGEYSGNVVTFNQPYTGTIRSDGELPSIDESVDFNFSVKMIDKRTFKIEGSGKLLEQISGMDRIFARIYPDADVDWSSDFSATLNSDGTFTFDREVDISDWYPYHVGGYTVELRARDNAYNESILAYDYFTREDLDMRIDSVDFNNVTITDSDNDSVNDSMWFKIDSVDETNRGNVEVVASSSYEMSLYSPEMLCIEMVNDEGYKRIVDIDWGIYIRTFDPNGNEVSDYDKFPKVEYISVDTDVVEDGRVKSIFKFSVSPYDNEDISKYDFKLEVFPSRNYSNNHFSVSKEYDEQMCFDPVAPLFEKYPVINNSDDSVRVRFSGYDLDSGIDPDKIYVVPNTIARINDIDPSQFGVNVPCTTRVNEFGKTVVDVDYTFSLSQAFPLQSRLLNSNDFSIVMYDKSGTMYYYYNQNGGSLSANSNACYSAIDSVEGYDYKDGDDYWFNPNNGTEVEIVQKGYSKYDVDNEIKVDRNNLVFFDETGDDYLMLSLNRDGSIKSQGNLANNFVSTNESPVNYVVNSVDDIEEKDSLDYYTMSSSLKFKLEGADKDYSINSYTTNSFIDSALNVFENNSTYVKSDITLRVDGTAPSTTGDLQLDLVDDVLTITQSEVTDSRSGLKEVYAYVYPSNSSEKGEKVVLTNVAGTDDYSTSVNLEDLCGTSYGNFTVEVHATDNVENEALLQTKEVFRKQLKPSIEGLTVFGVYEDEDKVWVNKDSAVSVEFDSSIVSEDGKLIDSSNIYLNDDLSISIDENGNHVVVDSKNAISSDSVNSSISSSVVDDSNLGGKVSNVTSNVEFGLSEAGEDYELSVESINDSSVSVRESFDKLISLDIQAPSIDGVLDTYLTVNNLELFLDLTLKDFADNSESVVGSGVKSVQAKLYKKGESSDEFIDLAFNESKGKFVVEDSVNLAEKFGNYKGDVVLEVYATDNVDNTDVVASTEFAVDLSSYVSTGDHYITSYDYKETNNYWLSSNSISKGFGIKVEGSSLDKIGTPSYNEVTFKDANSSEVYVAKVNPDGTVEVDEEFKSVFGNNYIVNVEETQVVKNSLTYNVLTTELVVKPVIDTEFEVSYKTVVSDSMSGDSIVVTDKIITDGVSPSSQTAPIVEVVDGKLNVKQFNIKDDGSGLDNSSVTCYVYPKDNIDKGQAINMSLNASSFDVSVDVFNHLKGYAGSVIIEILASDNVGNIGLVGDKVEFIVMPETPINSGVTVEHDGYETLDKIWLRDGNSITVNQSGNSKNTFITDSSIIINGSKTDVNSEARLNGSITNNGFTPSIDKNMFKVVDTSFNSESVASTKKTSASLKLEVDSSDLGVINDDLYVWGSSRIIVDDLMSASEWSNFAKPIGIDNEAPETISKLRLEKVNNATLIISQRNIEDDKSGLDASSVYAEMYEVNNPSKKIKIALPKSDTGAFYKEVDLLASGNLTGDVVVDVIASDNLGNSGVVSSGTFFRDLDSISNVDSSLTGSIHEDDNAHWINVGDNELALDGVLSSTNNAVGNVTVVITTNKDFALGDGTIAKIEIDENGSILEDLTGKVSIDESGKLVSADNGDATFDNSFGLDFVIDGSLDADEIYIWVSAGSDNVNTGFDRYEKPIKLDKENPNIEADLVSRDKVTIETSDLGSGVDKVIIEYVDGSQKELTDKVLQLDPSISKVTVVDNVGNKNSIELKDFYTSIDAKIVPEIVKNNNGFKSLKITATAQLNRNVDTVNATFRLRGIGEGIEFIEGDVIATSKNSLSHTLTLVDVDKDKDVSSVEVVEMENNIKRLVVTYSDNTYNDYYFCIESQYDFENGWTLEAEDFQSFVTVTPPVDEEPVPPVEEPDNGDSTAPDIPDVPDVEEPNIPDDGEEETPSVPDEGEEDLPTPNPPTDDEETTTDEEETPIPPVENPDGSEEELPTPNPPADDEEELPTPVPPTDDEEETPNPPVEDEEELPIPNPPVEDDSDDSSDNATDDSDDNSDDDSDNVTDDSDEDASNEDASNENDSNENDSNEDNSNEDDSNEDNSNKDDSNEDSSSKEDSNDLDDSSSKNDNLVSYEQEDDISDLENYSNNRLPQTGSTNSLFSIALATMSLITGRFMSKKKKDE